MNTTSLSDPKIASKARKLLRAYLSANATYARLAAATDDSSEAAGDAKLDAMDRITDLLVATLGAPPMTTGDEALAITIDGHTFVAVRSTGDPSAFYCEYAIPPERVLVIG